MQKPKEKRKNDEPQNLILRLIHAYIRWLRADFRTYRLVYFLPVVILISIPFSACLLQSVRLDYYYDEHIVFQVAVLIGARTHFLLYILVTVIGLGILLVKARGFLSLIVITIPIGFLIWGLGFTLLFFVGDVSERDSLTIGDYLYRVAWVEQYVGADVNDDYTAEYVIFRCDSLGVRCEPLTDGAVEFFGVPPRFELKIQGTQLHLYETMYRNENKRLVTTVDLD